MTAPAYSTPALRLEEFFSGRSRCWGLFEDRFGQLRRQFVIDLEGRWDGDRLSLTEEYRYDDGEAGRRVWSIRPVGPDGYEGTADDVVGVARGRVVGNRFRWCYAMDIKVGQGSWRVRFDDRLILQPDGVLLNRAHMSRWGVRLGSVTAAFRPWAPAAADALAA